jgi:FtsP/CotA-like multicopper oxidase with cupredoxin domain
MYQGKMVRPYRFCVTRRGLIAGAGAAALLRAPAIAQPDGFRVVRARNGSARLRGPNQDATFLRAFEGTVPGPVLRAKRGEEIRVRLANELVADTAIHWHGVRVPSVMDGVPGLTQAAIAPGESFDYRFTPPDAGTFWYRAFSRSVEDRALYGLLIVDEAERADVDRDVALIFDAWTLGSDGRLDTDGVTYFTVNGLSSLDVPVAANERVRLRLLNAARSRLLSVRLDRHTATVMAIDGQPAEPFPARDGRVTLSPGNRLDLFVDMTLAPSSTAQVFAGDEGREAPVARLVYSAAPPVRSAVRTETKPLPANALPERMNFAAAVKLDISLDDARYRGTGGGFGRPLFTTGPRQAVVIGFKNPTDRAHAVHLHGHSARLLDALDDGWKPFWLDTILAPPQRTTRVAFVADNRGKWLIESRALGGDGGINAWFEVT